MPTAKGWKRAFDEPIALPDGGELVTLEDAGRYVDALPRSMHEREEWQTVMEVLLSAAPHHPSQAAAANPVKEAANSGDLNLPVVAVAIGAKLARPRPTSNPSYLAHRKRICEGTFAAGVPEN
jgi:hypothetical protein